MTNGAGFADPTDIAKVALAGGKGGRRPGSGRPPKDPEKRRKPPEPDFPVLSIDDLLGEGPPPPLVPEPSYTDVGGVDITMPADPVALFAGARARKEAALAATAELSFRIKNGLYLPREAVTAAIGTAFQSLVQGIRSIPDNLERKLGVAPEIADAVGELLDASLNDIADELERIHTANYDSEEK